MVTRSKCGAAEAKDERNSVLTLRQRIKDKHTKYLRDVGLRDESGLELSATLCRIKVFQRERRFMSGYDLQKYTNGASKEGLQPAFANDSRRLPLNTQRGASSSRKLSWLGAKAAACGARLAGFPFKASGITYAHGQIRYGKVWLSLWDSYGLKTMTLVRAAFRRRARALVHQHLRHA
jgi:putative transposase